MPMRKKYNVFLTAQQSLTIEAFENSNEIKYSQ